ncbi:hypothetical protein [Brevundimonas vesicularis]|uniref:hypothetical protein n=1 Tax=Brevundimonas vesicularis TaxID=41276 RepID=UPI0038D38581
MAEDDERPVLPGSGAPPIEGRSWLWVKIAVWAVAVLLLILLAAFVAHIVAG